MQFRWVAAITVWTFISGPLFGPPHAPILQRDNQLSPLRQAAEQPPPRQPNMTLAPDLRTAASTVSSGLHGTVWPTGLSVIVYTPLAYV